MVVKLIRVFRFVVNMVHYKTIDGIKFHYTFIVPTHLIDHNQCISMIYTRTEKISTFLVAATRTEIWNPIPVAESLKFG